MRILILLGLALAAVPLPAQDEVRVVSRDSLTIRFVDADLRAVVQSLGQHLDRAILITGLPSVRVTVETPRAIGVDDVRGVLEGVLASQQLELVADSSAGLYRVRSRTADRPPPPAATRNALEPQGAAVQLFMIRLRHARAADVAATVNALYGRASAIGELGARPTGTLAEGLRGTRIPATDDATATSGAVPRLAGVTASFAGEVTIVPDAGTNGLLIRASRRDYELIEAAVLELDVRPLQVLIEVLIAEVRKDRGFSFGVAAEVPPIGVGRGNTSIEATSTGIGLGDFALGVMQLGGVDMNATLRAAASRGDVSISSRPVLLAANNELAEILVGSQRPFVQVSRSLPTDAPQRDQVVQYRDVGTRLSVRPTISADGYVMLEVIQEVNAVTAETAFDAPVISTRSVQTRLLVRNGQTAVLGGLADRQRDANQGGIPILSSIPLIGGLFGRASRRQFETELFVFLTPRVLFTDQDVDGATEPLKSRIPPEGR